MQKAPPIVFLITLASTATFLSFRPKSQHAAEPAPVEIAPGDQKVTPPPGTPSGAEARTTADPSWPQEKSDIPADPIAKFGKLENGMHYIIYPNAEPPKRVSLRMHIASGSLMEVDDQQGISHFLEHMVFNGSKHFKPDELIPKMQRLGIGFGAHVNAYTSFDETVYMLDLPDLSDPITDLGFTVMRDFCDGALLSAEEIDKERGVILSEKVSRDTVSFRLMQQQFNKLLPESLLAKRFPIGVDEVIKSAPRERFTDLYSRFYIPSRMTFIVVGDIDPAAMEAKIKETFGSMKDPENPGKNQDLGPIAQPEGIQPSVFADKEVTSTDVALMTMRPFVFEEDTVARRTKDLTLGIANSIVNRRFERISKVEGSAITSGEVSKSGLFNYVELGSIGVTAANDRWQDAVPVLEQEFRRAMDHGFTEAELAEAKSNVLNGYEQQVKQKATRKSETLASALAQTINSREVLSSPETELEIAKQALAGMTVETCHAEFKKFWAAPGYHLVLTTKESPEGAGKELAALFEESRGKAVDAPAARVSQSFGYTNFGKPGTVASTKEIKDLGITQMVLSNQVRLNLKQTDFEQGKIRLMARIGSGQLSQPKDMPMLDEFATAVYEGGGLGKHSNDDLQEILAGKNVGSTLTIGEDAFVLSGSTTPVDFTTQVQVMCASLTDPGYREEALWQFRKALPMMAQQLKHTPAGPSMEMNAWLHGDDVRYAVAPMEKLEAYTIEDARKWLTPALTKGYLELSIVGDFETSKILPQLLATFGALPTRASSYPVMADARKVGFPKLPADRTFTYQSKIPQGVATAVFKTAGVRGNQKEMRRLNVLADIYGDRLREEIREKLGASYSPNADAAGSDALVDFGYLAGQSIGKPEDLALLLKTMRELADKLADEGASDDELDRALKPVLSQLQKSLRDNSYWLGTVMSQCQSDPVRLDLARGRDADYASIKLTEINELAKKYLSSKNSLAVEIRNAE